MMMMIDDDDDDDGHLGGWSVAFPIPVLLHMTTLTLTYVISAQNFPLKDTHKNIPTTTRTKSTTHPLFFLPPFFSPLFSAKQMDRILHTHISMMIIIIIIFKKKVQ